MTDSHGVTAHRRRVVRREIPIDNRTDVPSFRVRRADTIRVLTMSAAIVRPHLVRETMTVIVGPHYIGDRRQLTAKCA